MLRSKWGYGAIVLVTGLALTACSSSSKSSSSSGTTAATSSTGAAGSTGSTGSSGSTGATGATPTGTPYELMNILSFPGPGTPAEPEVEATIKAKFDAINAAGGVKGHPVKLIQCLDHGDPNQARTCANQAVSNPNVLGTIFVFSNNDNVIDPIMEAAGMPQIGIDPQGSDDPKCNVCFAFDGGGLSDTAGIGTELHVYEGVNKIDMEIPEVPVAQAEMTVAKNNFLALNPQGSVKEQFVPLTVANFAPYVEATKGYEGTALFTAGPQLVGWVKEASSLGINMKWGILGCCVTPHDISQVGNLLNGALVATSTAPPDSNVAGAVAYRADVAKYAPGTTIDQSAMYGWMSAKFFADIANGVSGPLTRASLLAALRNVNNYTGFQGLIPPYSTTHTFTGLGGTLPYLYNVDLAPARLENGKITQISTSFINPFTGQTVNG
jgi:branched-chain amino acid transport system substrate-binding protein